MPLSFGQQRLWVLQEMAPESIEYNVPLVLRLTGDLDREAFEVAFSGLLARHEALRTTFPSPDGVPVQLVAPSGGPILEHLDLRGLGAAEARGRADARSLEEARRPFDLARGPLLRALLIAISAEEHVLALVMHHAVTDGWSEGILIGDLTELYAAELEGRDAELPKLQVGYRDFAVWQRDWLGRQGPEGQIAFWRERLAGVPVLELPTDNPRPAVRSGRGGAHRFEVPAPLAEGMRDLAADANATLFMALLAAYSLLLARLSGQSDFAIGTPISGRRRPELEHLVGFFINTLALRCRLEGDPSFRELLGRTRDGALEAYAHQDVPFQQLVEELRPSRDRSRTPIFQAILQLDQWVNEWHIQEPEIEHLDIAPGSAKTDISLLLSERPDGSLAAELEYGVEIMDAGSAARIAACFLRLLESILAEPDLPSGRLDILPAAERRRILEEFNDTASPYPDLCLHELIERQVDATPDAVAVRAGDEVLTYRQLDRRANGVAHRLRALGAGPGVPIGVCVGHGLHLLPALLGALKAGGHYVPLDPESPPERTRFIIADGMIPLIVAEADLAAALPPHEARIVLIDDGLDHTPTTRPKPLAGPEDLVYVIYTSGSTGRPKGVMIPHRALNNYLLWAIDGYGLGGRQGAPMVGSISFDLSIPNLFLPLLGGKDVTFMREQHALASLQDLLLDPTNDFSLLKVTPSHLDVLRASLPDGAGLASVRTYVVGADEVKGETIAAWRRIAPGTRIIDEYGPTETVVGCSTFEVPEEQESSRPIAIGKPIANMEMYVLDEELEPVPVGIRGELYIGGVGLARGYSGRPGATAERFVPHPFSDEFGSRIYRSGDLACLRSDGNLEYLGRRDDQVKIRSYRVELGEVEAALLSHPAVAEACVVAVDDEIGERRLRAHVVGAEGEPPGESALRDHLASVLPAYMLPSEFLTLASLPLTPAGKLDRSALPDQPTVRSRQGETAYVPVRNPTEGALAAIWAEILGVDHVGIHDRFFDLGGDSIRAVHAAHLAREGGIEVRPGDVFERQTVFELAELATGRSAAADRGEPESASALVRLSTGGDREATPIFCVHPSGGSVGWYRPLAEALGADRAVYAFQPFGLEAASNRSLSLADLAQIYVREMRQLQSDGPYTLLGWSMGGTIAFEMARQLDAVGQSVDPLWLPEPSLPGDEGESRRFEEELSTYQRVADLIDLALEAPEGSVARDAGEQRIWRLLEEVEWPRAEIGLGTALPMRMSGMLVRAYLDYVPRPYPGKVELIVSDECVEASAERPSIVSHRSFDEYLGRWSVLAEGGVNIHRVGRDHSTMLLRRNALELADMLKRHEGRQRRNDADRWSPKGPKSDRCSAPGSSRR